ncbi:MAG: septum formation family protein [Acidimicrobiia bacterium]|nr:septum formation family protein [Acidimicrobiia bacterium]
MATTVGKLANELGVPKDQVLDACKRTGVTAWSEHTPLDDGETDRVVQLVQAGSMAMAAPHGGGLLPPPPYGGPPPPGYAPPPGYGPPPYGPYPQPTPKRRGSAAVKIVAIVVGGIVALAVVGTILGEQEDAPSNEEEAGLELVIGDCWDDLTDQDATEQVVDAFLQEKPCSMPHDAEVFAEVTHPSPAGEPYPGDLAISEFSQFECVARFTEFVGIPYEQSSLDVVSVFPQDVGWERLEDRRIACSVVNLDGSPLTGSARGLAR